MQQWCSEPCINLCLLEYLLLVGVCAGYKWVPAGQNRNIFDSFLELTTASIPCFTTPDPQINHLGQFGGTGMFLTLPASRIQCLTFLWTGTTSLHLRLQRYSRSNLCSRCHLNRVLLLLVTYECSFKFRLTNSLRVHLTLKLQIPGSQGTLL